MGASHMVYDVISATESCRSESRFLLPQKQPAYNKPSQACRRDNAPVTASSSTEVEMGDSDEK